jgi:hypothetical protein
MTAKPLARVFRRKYILISTAVLVSGLGMGAALILRRPPRYPMERYVPGSALAFVQVDSLGQLVDGLTSTRAWRELAPPLGVSSQLRQVGQAADLIGRLGLGPSEAVIAGRAQYAVAVMGLEAETGSSEDGPYIHLKPHFVLLIKTHASTGVAASLVRDRSQILAKRMYGDSASPRFDDYFGSRIQVFDGPEPGHQFIAAAASDVVLIANDEPSIKVCLDVVEGRSPSLASNPTLTELRGTVDSNAAVFAFLTSAGVEKISGIAPSLFAARFTRDPDQMDDITNLFQHVSSQAVSGVLYGAELTSQGVTDRYLTVLNSSLSSDLTELMKPAADADRSQARMVPPSAVGFTILGVKNIGSLPERALKSMGPKFDLVGSLALKGLVMGMRKRMGLEGSDSVEQAAGDELTLVRFGDAEPEAMLIAVRDRSGLAPYVTRYLSHGGSVSQEQYNGVDLETSSNPDGRAAAIIENVLVLGTRSQIVQMIDYQNAAGDRTGTQVANAVAQVPRGAAIISCELASRDAGKAMLAVSRITRVTDGSPDLLDKDPVRKALQSLPPSVSFTRFQNNGVYTETRSAAGNFGLLASLGGGN